MTATVIIIVGILLIAYAVYGTVTARQMLRMRSMRQEIHTRMSISAANGQKCFPRMRKRKKTLPMH